MQIDPWSSQQFADYDRLRDEFGLESFEPIAERLDDPPPLIRRGIVFAHRGFETIQRAINFGEDWTVMTGLMPSGKMHFGHKMVIDQVRYFQNLGADIVIGVADLEAYATRGIDLDEGQRVAEDEYANNYLALGLDPDTAEVYYQSKRAIVQRLAFILGNRVNLSTFQALYGFDGEASMSHLMAPLVQAADILHTQLPEHGGARPVLVPVGVDQDPHIRLARDLADATRLFSIKDTDEGMGIFVKATEDDRNLERIAKRNDIPQEEIIEHLLDRVQDTLEALGFADFTQNVGYRALYVPGASPNDHIRVDVPLARLEQELGELGFIAPAATYHRFMSGLTGDKMSSSQPDSAIFLSDTIAQAQDKLNRSKTGGRPTAEEQREKGANPYICPVFEMYTYHLMPDDPDLEDIEDRCSGGKILCGECKGIAKDLTENVLEKLHAEQKKAKDRLSDLVTEE